MGHAAEPSPCRDPAGQIAEVAAWTQVATPTDRMLFIALCENMGGGIPMAVIRALVDAARTTGGERPTLRS